MLALQYYEEAAMMTLRGNGRILQPLGSFFRTAGPQAQSLSMSELHSVFGHHRIRATTEAKA